MPIRFRTKINPSEADSDEIPAKRQKANPPSLDSEQENKITRRKRLKKLITHSDSDEILEKKEKLIPPEPDVSDIVNPTQSTKFTPEKQAKVHSSNSDSDSDLIFEARPKKKLMALEAPTHSVESEFCETAAEPVVERAQSIESSDSSEELINPVLQNKDDSSDISDVSSTVQYPENGSKIFSEPNSVDNLATKGISSGSSDHSVLQEETTIDNNRKDPLDLPPIDSNKNAEDNLADPPETHNSATENNSSTELKGVI